MDLTHLDEAANGLNELSEIIIEVNRNNGWNCTIPNDWKDPYKIPAVLALVGTEVSEAVEAFRHDDMENFTEELADVIIRVLDCAAGLQLNIEEAIKNKIIKNSKRGHKHGGKRI